MYHINNVIRTGDLSLRYFIFIFIFYLCAGRSKTDLGRDRRISHFLVSEVMWQTSACRQQWASCGRCSPSSWPEPAASASCSRRGSSTRVHSTPSACTATAYTHLCCVPDGLTCTLRGAASTAGNFIFPTCRAVGGRRHASCTGEAAL